jgi:hypothetical protein
LAAPCWTRTSRSRRHGRGPAAGDPEH